MTPRGPGASLSARTSANALRTTPAGRSCAVPGKTETGAGAESSTMSCFLQPCRPTAMALLPVWRSGSRDVLLGDTV